MFEYGIDFVETFVSKAQFLYLSLCLVHHLYSQCHKIFDTFFYKKKTPPGSQAMHMNSQQRISEIFSLANIFAKIREKRVLST